MGNQNPFHVDISALHDAVTGSCIKCKIKFPNGEIVRTLIDCGLYHEKEYEKLNSKFTFSPSKIDFCLVTHTHVDHVGRLPFLVKSGFNGPIYLTKDASRLLPLALEDTYKVLSTNAKHFKSQQLFSEGDLNHCLNLTSACEYEETIIVKDLPKDSNIKITFLKNGHLPGSALILMQISYLSYDDINILFTGDFNSKNVFFDVPKIPQWVLELPLIIVQESTYGDMDSTEIVPVFKENVEKAINNNGSVIIPVFSLGRSQEILYELKQMQMSGQLSTSIPIYLDGKLTFKYTSLYRNGAISIKKDMLNFLPSNISFVSKENRMDVVYDKKPKIVVTSSGMGTYGPAPTYIQEYITRRRALIHFTGYAAEGTLARRLKDAGYKEAVNINSLSFLKEASVMYTSEFSAHEKADGMINFLNQFKKLNLVILNHGEIDTKEAFSIKILENVSTKKIAILNRSYKFRVNSFGLVKSICAPH